MDTETTRKLMLEYWAALARGHDFERYFTDDVTWTDMDTGDVFRGVAEVREHILVLHVRAFRYTPPPARSLGVEGGHVYLESDFVGTHVGEFDGVAPTGASVKVPFSLTYEWRNDKISAMRFYMSMPELHRQMARESESAALGPV